MASLGIATINVLARTTQFENSLRRSIKRIGISTAAILGGVAAGNFLQGAIKNSIDLEKQIKRIQTLLTEENAGFEDAFSAEAIRNLSNEVGIAAGEVADSLYLILSSGVGAADAMDVLRAASDSAIATASDLKQTVDFTTSALNAYGGTVDELTGQVVDAAHANDILFKALQYGKGSMNDFAKYVSTAIPIADALNISLSEVAAFAANNTLTGSTARKVFTGLKVGLQELSDETRGLGKAFLETQGQDFQAFLDKGGTIREAIKLLGTDVGKANLVENAGAKEGATALLQSITLWEQYGKTQEAMAGSAGAAAAGADKVNESLSRQIDILQNRFQNFRGSIGDWMGPVVADGIRKMDELRQKFNASWPEIKAGIMGFVDAAREAATMFWDSFSVPIMLAIDALRRVDWAGVGAIIQAAFTGIMIGVTPLISAFLGVTYIISGVMQALAPLVAVLNNMKPIIVGVTAAIVAYQLSFYLVATAIRVAAAAMLIWNGIQKAAVAVMALYRTALLLVQVATGKATLVQWQLNAALTANPIGLVIGLVVGLAAAFIYGWKTSEKFRNFVVGAWNAIKDGTLAAIKVMFNVMFNYFTIPIKLIQKLIGAVGHLPKWLGGGVADAAAGAVNNIVAGIESMKASLDGLIDKAMEADWALSQVTNSGVSMTGGNKLPPGAKLYLDKVNKAPAGPAAPAMPNFSGGGYNPDAGKDASKAADEAARKIKAAMGRIKADLTRIAKNTSKQTVDTIKNNFETLYADMKEGKVSKAIVNAAKKVEKQLLNLAKKRDSIVERLEVARDTLQTLKDDAAAFTKGIRDTVNAMGDVSQESRGFQNTFLGIRNTMRYAIATTQAFNANIERLRAMKLNDTSIRQLIDAGPEAAGAAARILASSGQAGVNEINNLQSQLTSAGNALATTGYNQFYANGIHMANGLVKGLESQEAAIMKQMDKMGDRMAAQFKKKLGIKSPSRVFAGLGEMIPAGLSKGIDSGINKVDASSQRMVDASITFGPGAVQVNGVGDPKAAQRAGILLGHGAAGVIAQKKTSQVLDGIG